MDTYKQTIIDQMFRILNNQAEDAGVRVRAAELLIKLLGY